MKNPNPHDGYAPDLFSEHARAAQLGLRVRDILRQAGHIEGDSIDRQHRRSDVALAILREARALLGTEDQREEIAK